MQKAQELGCECEVEKHVPEGQGWDGAQSTPWSDQRGFCPDPEGEGHPGPGPWESVGTELPRSARGAVCLPSQGGGGGGGGGGGREGTQAGLPCQGLWAKATLGRGAVGDVTFRVPDWGPEMLGLKSNETVVPAQARGAGAEACAGGRGGSPFRAAAWGRFALEMFSEKTKKKKE